MKNFFRNYWNFFTRPKDFFRSIKGKSFLQVGLWPFLIHSAIIILIYGAAFQGIVLSGDPGIGLIVLFDRAIYTIYIYLFFPVLYYFFVRIFSLKTEIRIQDAYNMLSFLTVFIPIYVIVSAAVVALNFSFLRGMFYMRGMVDLLLFLVTFY